LKKRDPDYIQFRPYQPISSQPKKGTIFSFLAGPKKPDLVSPPPGATREVPPRSRLLYFVLAVVVIGLGLAWRSPLLTLTPFLTKYGGTAWWALLIFLGFGFLFPRAKTWQITLAALAFTFSIEFSQLYHAVWIDEIRSIEIGSLILGNTFSWGDLPAYAIGVLLGALLESIAREASGNY
jgi:lysylphosphatidylglycerol synthetase-like protein (DUF2156 family)